MAILILFEDKHLVVCVKPRGVVSQADSAGKSAMPELLREQLGCEVYSVHRLDREVPGVMVFAKTRECSAKLSQMVSNHEVFAKEYLAVVGGEPEKDEGFLEDLLFHDRFKNKTYVVDRMRGGVKAAKLFYRVLAKKDGLTLVQVRLYTGRTHQIRVQFASRGLPLVGDKRYGAERAGEIALLSKRLSFAHPFTKTQIVAEAPVDGESCFVEFRAD